jgi:hypothetical protein
LAPAACLCLLDAPGSRTMVTAGAAVLILLGVGIAEN